MKLSEKQQIIYDLLAHSKEPLTARAIYDQLEPAELGKFRHKDDVSVILNQLRGKNAVMNDVSQYNTDNSTSLTWKVARPQTDDVGVVVDDVTETDFGNIPTQDPMASVDKALELIRETIANAISITVPTISHKQQKIAVIKHFENFSYVMNEDFARVLSDIAADLEKLESSDV